MALLYRTLVIAFMLNLLSCSPTNTENCHKIITFNNISDKTLHITSSESCPNTDSYKASPDPSLDPSTNKVLPNGINKNALSNPNICTETFYKDFVPSGILMVYVFDAQTLDEQGWDYIKANDLVLKRYDLTLKDLENMNWTITYNGN